MHRGGRHVVKVRLDDGSEILYKPHSMENEKQFGELLHWMSQGLKIAQLDYKFLSYEDHSWCSIVEYKSCKTEDEIKKYYKRIAIMRAIINKPQILLADEPTGNLDKENSQTIMNLFERLNKQGMTIVMVTHDTSLAKYGTRVVRVEDGRIIEKGKEILK